MNVKILGLFLSMVWMPIVYSGPLSAAGKPDITWHEANFLESAVNLHIEWQSPNPVVLVKVSLVNLQKEIKVDPYDNKRNRDGYRGELNVTLALDRDRVPRQSFTYVVQLEDELRMKSSPVTGRVDVPQAKEPANRKAGTIIVIIGPSTIADGVARWRVENGPWKKSGESVSDLSAGLHTIEFEDVDRWVKPDKKSVKIEDGKTLTINEIYRSR